MYSTTSRATLLGLVAILLWGTSVGLFRSLSEYFGPLGSPALIYTLSAVLLCLIQGLPRPGDLSRRYLIIGGVMFVSYEICLALSIGLAHNRAQSLELGMVNYLWPCLTVALATLINGQRAAWWLWPGLLLALGGVMQVLRGDGSWSVSQMWGNILSNPHAYGLAFCGALIWALYCNLTKRWGGGKNAIPLFFCATALMLWVKFILFGAATLHFTLPSVLQLLFMGGSTALAYSAWNYGIQHGNMTLLATASYFTPVFSALIASLWLGLSPGWSFWQGVVMVVAGSLLCWLAIRRYG